MRSRSIPYIITCLLLPFAAMGQERRVHWGIAAATAAKFQLIESKGNAYGPMGNWGLCFTTTIDGKNEYALSFTHRTGFYRDNIAFRPQKNTKYIIENINFIVNPEVLIPLRNPDVHITAGFGIDWISNANIAFHSSGDAYTNTFDFDKVADTVYDAQRPLVAFASLGIRLRMGNRSFFHAYVRQNLQNSIEGTPVVTLGNRNQPYKLTLFHQPTYVGLAMSFYFN